MATDAAGSDGHTRKRQFQPSIASYFDRSHTLPSSSLSQPLRSPLSPPLPSETQASLLSVGMRVRKSVPEGYKTHRNVGMQDFELFSTAPPLIRAPQSSSWVAGSPRELQPFCGLHKIGGLAQQESSCTPSSSAPAAMQRAYGGEESYLPGLSSSQATLSSTQSSFADSAGASMANSKKRSFEVEIEEGMDAFFDDMDASDAMIEDDDRIALRAIAQPRAARVRKGRATNASQTLVVDDFAEAPFLEPPEEMKMV